MEPFERYKHFKPASIACLGEVPAHWDTVLLGYLFAENKEKNTNNIEGTILSLSYGKVILKKGRENFGLLPAAYDTYQIINPGYLVFRFTDMQNDHVSLRVGLAQDRGIITSAYVGLKPRKELSSKYYYYLFHTLDILKFYYSFGGGVRQSLDFKGMRRIQLPLPPLAEQIAIANFLDCKTTQIDQFVALKEKTITLLQEQKSAIINRAVTQGLNPAAPMKDSGIEWLGEVPSHWEVKKLKRIFKNIDYGLSERGEREGKYIYLNMGHIQNGQIIIKEPSYLNQVQDFYLLEKDDILYNRTNSPELVAKTGIFKGDKKDNVTYASYLVRLRVHRNFSADYINLYLNSFDFINFARSQAVLSLHQSNLNPNRFSNFSIYVPPLAEQQQIVAHIEQATAKIDQAIAQAQQQIDLIKEYRESLISQAVTGKIRVIDNG